MVSVWSFQGTIREHSGNIQGTFSARRGLEPALLLQPHREVQLMVSVWSCQGTISEHSWNIQGTFREHPVHGEGWSLRFFFNPLEKFSSW
jgi:hypothetical protein